MRKKCGPNGFYQEWPTKVELKDNMNSKLKKLRGKLKQQRGDLYAYVLTTIKKRNGEFVQRGCGPNFQGGLITLCTCKHFMRTCRDVSRWKGVSIAGFTSVNLVGDNC